MPERTARSDHSCPQGPAEEEVIMAKIALLVPNESMLLQAHDVLQEIRTSLHIMGVIRTAEAVSEARKAANEGAEIIIARGIQATLIRQYTDLPVVEIVMTEESAEELVTRAKRIAGTEHPAVAFVMLRNMACAMTGLGEKTGVDLRKYFVQNLEMLRGSAEQAIADGADVLIGGAAVLETADRAGVPSLFLSTDETSMVNAIREAARLGETLEQEGEEEGSGGDRPGRAVQGAGGKAAEPFVNFLYRSKKMQECVDLAARLSAYSCPKLIIEETGTLKKAFVSAIHNHSPRAGERLAEYTCVEGAPALEELFGRRGIFMESGRSTVALYDIENLERRAQKRLEEMLPFRHVICVTSCPVPALREKLEPGLWYRLSAFLIRIPALPETPEDIPLLAENMMRKLCEKHGKYHSMQKEAENCLTELSWPGGRVQLESFLERLILSVDRRMIRREDAERIYGVLYGADTSGGNAAAGAAGTVGPYGAAETVGLHGTEGTAGTGPESGPQKSGLQESGLQEKKLQETRLLEMERERLLTALSENLGSREKTAEQLGISTTTLWRKLKKHGLV